MTERQKIGAPICPLCRLDFDEYYRTPRVVPKCGHTFCQKCIANRIIMRANRRLFVCTQCSSEVVIRKGVAEDVPKNMGILDIAKNFRRLHVEDRQASVLFSNTGIASNNCFEHNKPLELICETCSMARICSHCAVFGGHRNHAICKQASATDGDFKQLKEIFQIVTDTVYENILPQAKSNLRLKTKEAVTEGLKKAVTSHFKVYYSQIQHKENELLKECDDICLEGGIETSLEKLMDEYNYMKIKFENLTMPQNSTGEKISQSSMEQFIKKCRDFHGQIEHLSKRANETVQKLVSDVSKKFHQQTVFKITEMPVSLKRLLQDNIQEDEVPNIPRSKKLGSLIDSRLRPPSNKGKRPISTQGSNRNSADSRIFHNQPEKAKSKDKDHPSTIMHERPGSKIRADKIIKEVKEEIITEPVYFIDESSVVLSEKEFEEDQLYSKEMINSRGDRNRTKSPVAPEPHMQKLYRTSNAGQLEPDNSIRVSSSSKQVEVSYMKTMNPKQPPKFGNGNSIIKQLQPSPMKPHSPSTMSPHKPTASNVKFAPIQQVELKFVRVVKQIPCALLPKFHAMQSQLQKQSGSQTLELTNMELNDFLLNQMLDYMQKYKVKFQIIKLIKNNITDDGFKTLLSFLVEDDTTQILNMTGNHLTPKSLDYVLAFLKRNVILRIMCLSGNKIGMALKRYRPMFDNFGLEIAV